jgi:hypothetical protein
MQRDGMLPAFKYVPYIQYIFIRKRQKFFNE